MEDLLLQPCRWQPPSVEEWELDWLSRPYSPSKPLPVPDLIAEARALLSRAAFV